MVATLDVKFDDGLEKFLNSLSAKFPAEMRRRLMAAAQYAVGEIRGQAPHKRGGLPRSFKAVFIGDADKNVFSSAAVSDLVYARIQDEGGTIRPRTGKMLAIPHPMARIPPGKWPRHFPRGQLVRIGKILAIPILRGAGGKRQGPAELIGWRPMFILKPQVRITGHHYIEAAADLAAEPIADILRDGVEAAVEEA